MLSWEGTGAGKAALGLMDDSLRVLLLPRRSVIRRVQGKRAHSRLLPEGKDFVWTYSLILVK